MGLALVADQKKSVDPKRIQKNQKCHDFADATHITNSCDPTPDEFLQHPTQKYTKDPNTTGAEPLRRCSCALAGSALAENVPTADSHPTNTTHALP